jgi:hypothetical protein
MPDECASRKLGEDESKAGEYGKGEYLYDAFEPVLFAVHADKHAVSVRGRNMPPTPSSRLTAFVSLKRKSGVCHAVSRVIVGDRRNRCTSTGGADGVKRDRVELRDERATMHAPTGGKPSATRSGAASAAGVPNSGGALLFNAPNIHAMTMAWIRRSGEMFENPRFDGVNYAAPS